MGKKLYTIYDVRINNDTYNWSGSEWVIDGERGRITYPGEWKECLVRRMYSENKIYLWELPECRNCAGTSRCDKH